MGCRSQRDFNPLPSCEGRHAEFRLTPPKKSFQSTPLMRGETLYILIKHCQSGIFQSTPLMRGETSHAYRRREKLLISIHSPHARGDPASDRLLSQVPRISIHSPHARGDVSYPQSILPRPHFNPLPSCEGRQHKPLKIRLDSRQFIQQNHHSSFF